MPGIEVKAGISVFSTVRETVDEKYCASTVVSFMAVEPPARGIVLHLRRFNAQRCLMKTRPTVATACRIQMAFP